MDTETRRRLEAAREFVTLANTVWKDTLDGARAQVLAEQRMEVLAYRIMDGLDAVLAALPAEPVSQVENTMSDEAAALKSPGENLDRKAV